MIPSLQDILSPRYLCVFPSSDTIYRSRLFRSAYREISAMRERGDGIAGGGSANMMSMRGNRTKPCGSS